MMNEQMKNPATRERCGVYWYGGEGVPLPPVACLTRTAGVYCSWRLQANIAFILVQRITQVTHKMKNVFVNAYVRFRFGRNEHVCQHWRSHPGQLAFAF